MGGTREAVDVRAGEKGGLHVKRSKEQYIIRRSGMFTSVWLVGPRSVGGVGHDEGERSRSVVSV